ncbi:hypothetical protein IFM89_018379 [Coptis chinensis]|uniref:BAHD acyltransferase n=1 Tax=Coptis chinensis TaxID=261450 RepID=A0A835LRY5_9MAGN|nr:hypothetical protein IFM89_018379 [Coptis chinensis]
MTLDVKVLSQETIKPSSPTPNHLRNFTLSLVDQYAPPAAVSLILFYPANNNASVKNDERSHRLKGSLSEILTHFYPLAGTIDNNQFIECNDEGVNFFEARVTGRQLSQILNHPIPEELDQLVHRNDFYREGPRALLSIQANIFDCGGMALGVCISHKAADASSFGLFLNNWAAVARGDSEIPQPKLGQTSLFPPKDVSSYVPFGASPIQKVVNKFFVFNAGNIASLKAKASHKSYVEHPTRVEAVSALIWRCALNASRTRPGSVKSVSVAALAMNLRGKMVPALSNLSFGNFMIGVMATTTESAPELHCLVGELRETKMKVDDDYVRKLQVDDGLALLWNSLVDLNVRHIKGELELYTISSWCGFSFYEADFGWGKPMWITSVNLVTPNIFMLMDSKCGIGVEASVTLDEEVMARFECDPELIAFTSTTKLP